jgi:hypothetical protein
MCHVSSTDCAHACACASRVVPAMRACVRVRACVCVSVRASICVCARALTCGCGGGGCDTAHAGVVCIGVHAILVGREVYLRLLAISGAPKGVAVRKAQTFPFPVRPVGSPARAKRNALRAALGTTATTLLRHATHVGLATRAPVKIQQRSKPCLEMLAARESSRRLERRLAPSAPPGDSRRVSQIRPAPSALQALYAVKAPLSPRHALLEPTGRL